MNSDELEFHKKVSVLKEHVSRLNAELIDVVMLHMSPEQTKDYQASLLSSIALTFHNSMALVLERVGVVGFIRLTPELIKQSEEILSLEEQFNTDEDDPKR